MRNYLTTAFLAASMLFLGTGCKKDAKLNISLPEKFEGKTVELISFGDSAVIADAVVTDGKAEFINPAEDTETPLFTQLVIDGRVKAFYIMEPGNALISDSLRVASGTPLNDRFAVLMTRLDSVENLDDMSLYLDYVEKQYNENKDNVFGNYFGVEWLKYAEPQKVDSLLAIAPESLTKSRRAEHYIKFAKLRAATAPGKKYTDFEGENEKGKKVRLKDYIHPGNYTILDFWASWCPYCIKELPDLTDLYDKWHEKGVDILGVAVRDKTEDTLGAIEKFSIKWPSLFNTQKTPYDIYGFSGIPHHILIGPDGTILSRGESAAQIDSRLETLIGAQE